MIPRTIPTWQAKSWQEELSELITDPKVLFSVLKLDPQRLDEAIQAQDLFPLRATQSFVARITPGDFNDPLLRQILPLGEEFQTPQDFNNDPLEEESFTQAPGLIHKYHGRVLLIAASQCAINCRYCFRRHFDYQSNTPSRHQWQETISYIRNKPEIDEVILSGGDPLAISDKQFTWFIDEISKIPHVERLRIHSRLPIVSPSRITDALCHALASTRLNTVMVVHCNHSQEIDEHVSGAFNRLRNSDTTLLNQTVLLKGINDDASCLVALSKSLFRHGVLPYYLHLLDKVQGASHFLVDETRALSINQALLANLPGYLVPKLVKEVPNATSKVPVN